MSTSSSSGVTTSQSVSSVGTYSLKCEETNTFVRLIESEKSNANTNSGEVPSESESDLLDQEDDEIGLATAEHNGSPSPQPQPDLQLTMEHLQQTLESGDDEWSAVQDVCVLDPSDPNSEKRKEKVVMKKSTSISKEETVTRAETVQVSQQTTSVSSQSRQVVSEEVKGVVQSAETNGHASEVVNGTEIKAKRRSKKSSQKTEHISVEGSVESTEGLVSISRLKSLYSGSSSPTDLCEERKPSPPPPKDQKVFAKVCVANLRRSFCDLTNLTASSEEPIPRVPRPNSGGGGGGEVTRSASDFGGGGGGRKLYPERVVESGGRSVSLVDLQASCRGVSVQLLKSSFSKFDQLAKKSYSVERSASNIDQAEQANGEKSSGPAVEQKLCKSCGKEVFLVELMKAEKCFWHRNCFRCVECSKPLNVDSYSSHEGKLYCKPHFKKLFQPKVVFDESGGGGGDEQARPEVIIRESQPTELPPDVARASEKQTTGLEDINVDVRSKFEMFEHFKDKKVESSEPVLPVKRSGSVLKRLARYEGSEVVGGVPNDELHGEVVESGGEESGEENDVIRAEMARKMKSPLAAMAEIMQCKQMEEVRAKWEDGGINHKQEELSEHRRAEMNKFRTRLCQGKSNQLKEMYEKALESGTPLPSEDDPGQPATKSPVSELEALRLEKAKRLREMFEKGEVHNEDEEGEGDGKRSLVQRDSAVFESGVAKQSRSLFKELDENLVKSSSGVVAPRSPANTDRVNKQNLFTRRSPSSSFCGSGADVVRAVDRVDDTLPVKTEDLTNKFNFFETYEKQLEDSKRSEKKAFRITPPRDTKLDKEVEVEQEVYRDPNVVRADESKGDDLIIQKSRTTSKMLNVFRQLEEQSQVKDPAGPRPLKQFTPPREPARVLDADSEEEYEDGDEDEADGSGGEGAPEDDKDAFLKEVGSLARARSLRARFERWETEENARNRAGSEEQVPRCASVNGDDDSIESARNLRAKFEQIQQLQLQETAGKREKVKVRRFVELTNTGSDGMSEECAFCEKKVYAMEKLEANSKVYHKNCFRCSVCKAIMRMDSFTFHHGALYCKNHFKQLFKIKGNYDEGFGHETQKQIFARKQAEKENQ